MPGTESIEDFQQTTAWSQHARRRAFYHQECTNSPCQTSVFLRGDHRCRLMLEPPLRRSLYPRSPVKYWQRSTPMPAKHTPRSVVASSSDHVTAPSLTRYVAA